MTPWEKLKRDRTLKFIRDLADDRTEGDERQAERYRDVRWRAQRLLVAVNDRPERVARVPGEQAA